MGMRVLWLCPEWCAEFGEHALGGFRMEKGDKFAGRTFERFFVDELATGVLGLHELALDVVGRESHVMHAAVGVLFEEFGDGTFGRGRLEEFEVGFPDVKKGGANLLARHFLDVPAFQAEGLFVVRNGVLQRAHRNAEMVNALQHGLMVAPRRRAGKD